MSPALVRGLAAVAAAVLLAGCSSETDGTPSQAAAAFPGLTAPVGQGLVGEPTGELALVPPATAPVGSQVPAIGTCIEPVVDMLTYLNDEGLGTVTDCAGGYGGVVVGVDGFRPEDLAIDPTGRGFWTLEDWQSPAEIAWLKSLATPGCRAQLEAVADHALSLGGGVRRVWSLRPVVRMPSYDQWRSGERWVACVFLAPAFGPVDGDVDVLALTADQPLPASLQVCATTVGDRTPCDPGAATQQWLDLPIDDAQTPPVEMPMFSDEARDQLLDACARVLGRLAPDLAAADWVSITLSERRDLLDNSMETSEAVVGARCGLQNENFGVGLEDFLR